MAPKHSKRLVEDPPPASSSEEEEKEEDEEQEGVKNGVVEEEDEDEEDDDDQEEEGEDGEKDSPLPKNPTVAAPTPSKAASESGSDSDSDSDSESTQSPSPSAYTIKPIASKPLAKPQSNKSPAPKRPAESDSVTLGVSKKKEGTNGGADDEDMKKGRLWNEEDEIAILKGMIQYKTEKGADTNSDMGAFYEFVKKSLHADVSKNQLMTKIKRLKKKYKTNAEKGEDGEEPEFSESHDANCFELSKKIWGDAESKSNKNEKAIQSSKAADDVSGKAAGDVSGKAAGGVTLALASQKIELGPRKGKRVVKEEEGKELSVKKLKRESNVQKNLNVKEQKPESSGEVKGVVKAEVDSKEEVNNVDDYGVDESWEKYPHLSASLEKKGLPEGFLREMLWKIGKQKKTELEGKWKKLKQAELELYMRMLDLNDEQVRLALNVFHSEES